MADRTTFVIAHRLSTVRNANAIMVLEKQEEIIERGGPRRFFGPEGTVLQPVYGQGRTGINLNMDLTFLSADLRLLSPWPLILHFFKYKGLKLTILLICKGFTNCTSY